VKPLTDGKAPRRRGSGLRRILRTRGYDGDRQGVPELPWDLSRRSVGKGAVRWRLPFENRPFDGSSAPFCGTFDSVLTAGPEFGYSTVYDNKS